MSALLHDLVTTVALGQISGLTGRVGKALAATFLSLDAPLSLASLAGALTLATAFIVATRLHRRGRIGWRLLWRALKPRPAVSGASGRTDVGFFLLNTFCVGGLIGWALLSQAVISRTVGGALAAQFGHSLLAAPGWVVAAATTIAVFLAYELAYWVDHWLSHNVDFLWEIHRVHHSAQALSPLTNYRVHPLETLKFYNILALFTGVADGVVSFALNGSHTHLTLFGVDVAVLAFTFTVAHLQHSHVWIGFRGGWGRLLMSPAHHQIHHSADPRHFGRNLGSALSVFGTLWVPAEHETLSFGVAGDMAEVHTITGALITPVQRAVGNLAERFARLLPAKTMVDAS